MHKVAVVIDSTANIPQSLLDQYHIHVLPQTLVWDNVTYRDGIDISPDQFYERLSTSRTIPTTSQVTPAQFLAVYENLFSQGYDVFTLVISAHLSGTLQSAIQARAQSPAGRVTVVDSYTTSMTLGYQAIQVARAAEQGATLAECEDMAMRLRTHGGILFVVDTLKYLHLGGRIGGGARFLGTALDLKPILELTGGRIEAIERVRSKTKAIDRLLAIAELRIAGRTPLHLATLHAKAYNEAAELLERAKERFHPIESYVTEVSPVVGVHAGPGVVGLAFLAGD
ncbi:MAG TPA: DegV family protein [Anaerolineaceae bacterium]|jgi:DegV family protein with EDD domain